MLFGIEDCTGVTGTEDWVLDPNQCAKAIVSIGSSGAEVVYRLTFGSVICIVAGVSVPLILRPSGSEYVLIGDSYLHGVMDGEAMKLRQSLELPITQFCLV